MIGSNSEIPVSIKYGVWYAWADQSQCKAWSHIKVNLIDDNLPTVYHRWTDGGRRLRVPTDAGFWAVFVDSITCEISYFGPPMQSPRKDGGAPGEEYLAWLLELIRTKQLVETSGTPYFRRETWNARH